MSIKLYDQSNIDTLEWIKYEDGEYAENYLKPLITYGVSNYISNVRTDLMIIVIDDYILPITKNNKEYDNSYVVSNYSLYINYAKEELQSLNKPWLSIVLKPLLSVLSKLFKISKVNKSITVNNWMLSTNLYFDLTKDQITRLTTFLTNKFPQYNIVFRSIHTYEENNLFFNFKNNKYKMIPSRQVYFYNPNISLSRNQRKSVKRDSNLFKNKNYLIHKNKDLREADINKIVKLYSDLYLEKYSFLNPIFTDDFIRLAITKNILNIIAIRENDDLIAVLGYFERNGLMTTPLFGYNTSFPIKKGLYRMLSNIIMTEAEENNFIAHQSSGASEFKRVRGSKPNIEYSAIYDKHLPLYRRVMWSSLEFLLEKIGVSILKKYKL